MKIATVAVRIAGWNALIAGVLGIVGIVIALAKAGFSKEYLPFFIPSLLLFPFSLLAGVSFVRGHRRATSFLLWVYSLQVVKFNLDGFAFIFSGGLELIIRFGAGFFQINPGYYASAWFGNLLAPESSYLSVNVLALFFIGFLLRLKKAAVQQAAAPDASRR